MGLTQVTREAGGGAGSMAGPGSAVPSSRQLAGGEPSMWGWEEGQPRGQAPRESALWTHRWFDTEWTSDIKGTFVDEKSMAQRSKEVLANTSSCRW